MKKKLHWAVSAAITLAVFIGLLFGVSAILSSMANNTINSMSQELKDAMNEAAGITADGTAIASTAAPEAEQADSAEAPENTPERTENPQPDTDSQAAPDAVSSGLVLSPALEAEWQSIASSIANILTIALVLYAVILILVSLLWCFLSARHYSRKTAWKVGSNVALILMALYTFMNMLALLTALVGDSAEFRSIIAVISAVTVGVCCFILYKFAKHFEDDKQDLRTLNTKLGR